MRRYLSVWLPRWQIERRSGYLALQQGNGLPPDARRPLVLSATTANGQYVGAANAAAEALGVFAGMPLADARAIHPELAVAPTDEEGDTQALRQLTLWCQRYSPLTRTDPPDGLMIDITGCAHLFDGEAALAGDLDDRLHGFGLCTRIAIAPTIGAASMIARHGEDDIVLVPPGETARHIAPLPVAGLRLDPDTVAGLHRLGLRQAGMLIGKPRAPLVSRFGRLLVLRLDQALGLEDEYFNPLSPPPVHRSACRFAEPVTTLAAIEETLRRLARDLARDLETAGKAPRRLVLTLFRVDGWHETLDLRISRPSRDAAHLCRLMGERLDRLRDNAGFGFESATLGAFDVEDFDPAQDELAGAAKSAGRQEDDIARLLDRLANRVGARNVTRFVPRESYVPERACQMESVFDGDARHDWAAHAAAIQGNSAFARPLLMLDPPEPIEVIVETPDKPPARFTWRRVSRHVTRADGPERIAPEWWGRDDHEPRTRDYYRVEDEAGRRFWLYREGLYERPGDAPRWFMHGVLP